MPGSEKPKLDLTVRGSTGLPVWAGRIYDEPLSELQGDKARVIYREMSEQDPIIGGVLLGIELLARQVQWTIKPAEVKEEMEAAQAEADAATAAQPDIMDPVTGFMQKKPKVERAKTTSEEVADFVDQCLTDMTPSWGMTLSEILTMLPYGWSWLEILYKRREGLKINDPAKSSMYDDGKIGWGGWPIRAQDTLWEWIYSGDKTGSPGEGNIVAMSQQAPPNYQVQEIPRWKSLHFTTKSRKQNPEGVSILRNAFRSWYMKKNIEVIEGIGVERDLAGLPILWAPSELFSATANAEEKALLAHLQTIVTSIKRDEQEGILMPMAYDEEGKNPLYKIELLSTAGDRQFDTNAIIGRYDERIAMSMMADFLLIGHQSTGSYAMSTSKMNMFSTSLSAILDVIIDEINLNAIPQLVLLNGWDLKYCPTLQHGKIEANDLRAVGEYLRQLNAAGMPLFPNKALEIYLLESAGLPSDPGAGSMPGAAEEPGLEDIGLLDPAASNPLADLTAEQAKMTKMQAKLPAPAAGGQPGGNTPAGNGNPAKGGNQAKTGKDGDIGDLTAPRVRPRRATPGMVRPARRAFDEPERPKHFVPLAQRVAKLREPLKAAMSPEAYQELVVATMEAGQFSRLSEQHQHEIRKAEAAS